MMRRDPLDWLARSVVDPVVIEKYNGGIENKHELIFHETRLVLIDESISFPLDLECPLVYTDHASLRTATQSHHLSQKMARWLD